MKIPILNRFFKSRDKPIMNYLSSNAYSFFFEGTSSGHTLFTNDVIMANIK